MKIRTLVSSLLLLSAFGMATPSTAQPSLPAPPAPPPLPAPPAPPAPSELPAPPRPVFTPGSVHYHHRAHHRVVVQPVVRHHHRYRRHHRVIVVHHYRHHYRHYRHHRRHAHRVAR